MSPYESGFHVAQDSRNEWFFEKKIVAALSESAW